MKNKKVIVVSIFSLGIIFSLSCGNKNNSKSETTIESSAVSELEINGQQTEMSAQKISSSTERKVYEADGNGNKKDILFIYKDNNLYEIKKDGSEHLIFSREGKNVYEVRNGVKKVIFIIENENFAYDTKDGEKSTLMFIKEGNLIYDVRNGVKKGVLFILE